MLLLHLYISALAAATAALHARCGGIALHEYKRAFDTNRMKDLARNWPPNSAYRGWVDDRSRTRVGRNANEEKSAPFLLGREDVGRVHKRLVYLDVGANDPSGSVLWFLQNYPRGEEFLMHAWEPNPDYAEAFAEEPYKDRVVLHQQAAWVYNGTLEFLPGRDASIIAALRVKPKGVFRNFHPIAHSLDRPENAHKQPHSEPIVVACIDLAAWMMENLQLDDFVVLKLDVEMAEYDIVLHLIRTGAIWLVDEALVEQHAWGAIGWWAIWPSNIDLVKMLRFFGISAFYWN